jgi:hypothetical protein
MVREMLPLAEIYVYEDDNTKSRFHKLSSV